MELNAQIKDYWEGEAEVYSKGIKEELNSPQKKAWKDLILGYAPQKKQLEILDVGTGPGFFPIILSEEGHRVTGIDITENMIKQARENLEAYGGQAELMTMDCQKLDFEDETFDMVLCRNITWTLNDPMAAYKEWTRVLKPGGRLMVFDACWYLWLFDDGLKQKYCDNERKILEKYGRRIHAHADPEKGDDLSKKLYMSDKARPQWDLEYLIKLGFTKVFAQPDISELIWNEREKEINAQTPEFMVGAEK